MGAGHARRRPARGRPPPHRAGGQPARHGDRGDVTVAALSYESGTGTTPLLGETIGENLVRIAGRFAEREALVDRPSGRRWTYRELLRDVRELARALLAHGIVAGDRVGIWAPNCPEWVLVQYATALIGAILVNVNPAYRSHELEYALQQSGVRLLVTVGATTRADFPAIAGDVATRCPTVDHVAVVGQASFEELVARAGEVDDAALDTLAAALDPDDAINIQYTSGTTGFPKGATLSHHNILNNGYFVGELLGYDEHDRICLPVPFYHCFGMVMGNLGATTHGSCIVVPAPSFDAEATLDAVAAERCTSLYGVPTMFIAQLNHPSLKDHDLSSLRTGIMAGSPCPVEIMKRVIDEMNMSAVAICYGMTETSPVSTQTRADDDLDRRTATVGRVLPHLEVKICDPATGRLVERGQPGELCTRGYSVMLGYWENPDATAQAIDRARWMHTGDLAVMRDDGYVNIVGRIKDMVIRGGENVYPREIEEFLYTHPDIVDAQVIGVPDAHYGEELCVWIRRREGADPIGPEELRIYCEGRLAHFKIPRYVHLTDEFPMTVTGKVRKVEMRERSIALLGLEEVARTAHA
jgi:fatty-acyl-CoA synthase